MLVSLSPDPVDLFQQLKIGFFIDIINRKLKSCHLPHVIQPCYIVIIIIVRKAIQMHKMAS